MLCIGVVYCRCNTSEVSRGLFELRLSARLDRYPKPALNWRRCFVWSLQVKQSLLRQHSLAYLPRHQALVARGLVRTRT